jgi:anti-sigma factor RsiW
MSPTTLECREARKLILDQQRDRLNEDQADVLRRHLESCVDCQAYANSEGALTDALTSKMPRFLAPPSLKKRIALAWPSAPSRRARLRPALVPVLAAAAALAIGAGGALVYRGGTERQMVVSEAVNDHLRSLEGAPLSEVTGGLHEVRPWFGGKIDFAPSVAFAGDADFPMQGGAVERFLDRRAAVFVYKRRLHAISLFVVRSDGLSFPVEGRRVTTARGFTVVLWKRDDQGFALVSDLGRPELLDLQQRIVASGGE